MVIFILQQGFGSIEKSVSERQQEFIYGVDASSTINLYKFFGDQSGINLPMYVGYSRNVIRPLYDPLSPDLLFEKEANEEEIFWNERFYNGIDLTGQWVAIKGIVGTGRK